MCTHQANSSEMINTITQLPKQMPNVSCCEGASVTREVALGPRLAGVGEACITPDVLHEGGYYATVLLRHQRQCV